MFINSSVEQCVYVMYFESSVEVVMSIEEIEKAAMEDIFNI